MSSQPQPTPTPNLEQRIEAKLRGWSRMGLWLLFACIGLGVVFLLAPQMVKVSIYKLSLLPAAVYVLYWIDRALNEKRPHEYFDAADALDREAEAFPPDSVAFGVISRHAEIQRDYGHERTLRRTLLIAAGMIAVALGS